MTKELGDVTLRELAEMCAANDNCADCPMCKTKLNCWGAYKLLREDNGGLLDTEVDL